VEQRRGWKQARADGRTALEHEELRLRDRYARARSRRRAATPRGPTLVAEFGEE